MHSTRYNGEMSIPFYFSFFALFISPSFIHPGLSLSQEYIRVDFSHAPPVHRFCLNLVSVKSKSGPIKFTVK